MISLSVIGHLGQDATVGSVNGRTVINFTIAHSEKFKNKDGVEETNTIWLSCAYWTEKTNLALYLKKGTQVYLEGKPEAKIYTNKNNQVIPQLHVRVSFVQLLSSNKPQEQKTEFINQPNGFESETPPF